MSERTCHTCEFYQSTNSWRPTTDPDIKRGWVFSGVCTEPRNTQVLGKVKIHKAVTENMVCGFFKENEPPVAVFDTDWPEEDDTDDSTTQNAGQLSLLPAEEC